MRFLNRHHRPDLELPPLRWYVSLRLVGDAAALGKLLSSYGGTKGVTRDRYPAAHFRLWRTAKVNSASGQWGGITPDISGRAGCLPLPSLAAALSMMIVIGRRRWQVVNRNRFLRRRRLPLFCTPASPLPGFGTPGASRRRQATPGLAPGTIARADWAFAGRSLLNDPTSHGSARAKSTRPGELYQSDRFQINLWLHV